MEAKEILTPRNMLVALGTVVIVMSFYGMANGDKWAEYGWGEDNVCLLYTSPSPRDGW